MTLMKSLMGAAATLALSAGAALAEPALIFDLGGKFDKSFNEAAFGGAQRWAEETGGTFREIELQAESLRLASEGIGKITGRISTEMVLDELFTRFCIGK